MCLCQPPLVLLFALNFLRSVSLAQLWPVKLSSHFLQAVFGIFTFVAGGIWTGFRFLPGVPTILGFIFVSAVVLFPVSAGAAIIRRQLRLPRHSN